MRVKDGVQYLFVLNYSKEEQTIRVKQPMQNLYTGETVEGTIKLAKYETLVLKK